MEYSTAAFEWIRFWTSKFVCSRNIEKCANFINSLNFLLGKIHLHCIESITFFGGDDGDDVDDGGGGGGHDDDYVYRFNCI